MGSAADSRKTQIAAMLNMFEYLDYHMGEPGIDLRTLVSEAEQYFASNPPRRTEQGNHASDLERCH